MDYLRAHTGRQGIEAARRSYAAWVRIAEHAVWDRPTDVKRSHPKASILKGDRVVFNIKANDFRLVAQINYRAGTVEIRFFGSHREYDRINAEMV